MGLIAKQGERRPPTPEGVYVARCYSIIDLGTQNLEWQGKAKQVHKIHIAWEFPTERIEIERDGKAEDLPRVISQRYTLSLDRRAKLRQHLDSWRGRSFSAEELEGFDLQNIIGATCQIQVIHSRSDDGSRTYANVNTIMAMPKGMDCPPAENPTAFFSMADHGVEPPEGTPEFLVEAIHNSVEWQASAGAGSEGASDDLDEIIDADHPASEFGADGPPF